MTDPNRTVYTELITEARDALGRRNNGGELPAEIIALAQVSATLAVAEQARISNLIAYASHRLDHQDATGVGRGFTGHLTTALAYVDGDIRRALGIETPGTEKTE